MDSLKQAFARTALGLAEYMVPVLRTSKFRETGVITPEEFVAAGDFLVHHCPTWQWATGDKPPRDYLPTDKQYLLTRNVPCYRRIGQLEYHYEGQETTVEDDWISTHPSECNPYQEKPSEILAPADHHSLHAPMNEVQGQDAAEEEEDDEEAEDMESFMQRGMLDEVDPVVVSNRTSNPADTGVLEDGGGGDILRTRTYDLYITYDKYYQTPRMWLYGYDEYGRPLTEEEMFEDFSQDHVKKTVTVERHPHLTGPPIPSIHPCQQAKVMRKLIDAVAEEGAELAVHQYMMVFLKFVQAVIPTIEYDYTRNFSMS